MARWLTIHVMPAEKTKHGLLISEWEEAKSEIALILRRVAARAGTIYYGDLVEEVKSVHLGAADSRLNAMLAEISKLEDAEGRGMLSAVVVTKASGIPGPGFFPLARRLGRDTTKRFSCWKMEHDRVCAHWVSQADAP